jgi:hypothetical protein
MNYEKLKKIMVDIKMKNPAQAALDIDTLPEDMRELVFEVISKLSDEELKRKCAYYNDLLDKDVVESLPNIRRLKEQLNRHREWNLDVVINNI